MTSSVESSASKRHELPGFDGGPWVADIGGPRDAPTVLLLHGGGQTRHAWGGTALAMAQAGWRTVALDLPGHGESAWSPSGDYRIETLSRDMARFCHTLGSPLALVGASLGGMISMAMSARSDAPPIAALALVDIAPRVESKGVDRIVEFMRAHPEGFATLEDAARHIASYRGRPVMAHPRGLQKNLRLNQAGRWTWHWDRGCNRRGIVHHPHEQRSDLAGKILGVVGIGVPTDTTASGVGHDSACPVVVVFVPRHVQAAT